MIKQISKSVPIIVWVGLMIAGCEGAPTMDTDTDMDTEQGDDDDMDTDSGGDVDGDSDMDTDSDSDTDTDTDTDTDMDGDGDSDTDTDTDVDTDGDSDSDSDSDTDTDTDADGDTDSADFCDPGCVSPDCWIYDCSGEACGPPDSWGPCEQALDSPVDCEFEAVVSSGSASRAILLPGESEMVWKCKECDRFTLQWFGRVQGPDCARVRVVAPDRWVRRCWDDCEDLTKCVILDNREEWRLYIEKGAGPGWMWIDLAEDVVGDCPLTCP